MSTFTQIASFDFFHEYWGTEKAPISFSFLPAPPPQSDQLKLLNRAGGADLFALSDWTTEPVTVAIASNDPVVFDMTEKLDFESVARFHHDVTGEEDVVEFTLVSPNDMSRRQRGDQSIATISLTGLVNLRATPAKINLSAQSVSAHWVYHVLGIAREAPVRIVDPAGLAEFQEIDGKELLDGRWARRWQSLEPITLKHRPPQRFALEQLRPAPQGPVSLVSVLPAASPPVQRASDGVDGSNHCHIFIQL